MKGWLASARAANLPTVWSAVLAGWLLGGQALVWLSLTLAMAAASSIYIGGCLLGDFFDRGIDARERPDRPLPSGLIPAWKMCAAGIFLLIAGVALALANGLGLPEIWLGLGICVFLYALLHSRSRILAMFLMPLCRGLLGLCLLPGWDHPATPLFLVYGASLFSYTLGIMCVGITDLEKRAFTGILRLQLLMFIIPLLLILPLSGGGLGPFLAVLPLSISFGLALRALRMNEKGSFVSRSLAAFCLLDFFIICALFLPPFTPMPLIFPALFLLAILAQKVTPAT